MRTHLFKYFCLLFLFCGTLRAGQPPADTLLTRYYNKAADLIGEEKYDSAQHYFDKAFAVKGVALSPLYPILLNEQATLLIHTGEYEKAMNMKKQVLPYLPHVEDKEKHISVYNDLGILYRRQNMNDSAMYYYDKALDVASGYPDKSWIANLSLNVAILHYNLNRIKEAEKYIDQALEYIRRADDPGIMLSIWQVRGTIKMELGKKEEAGQSLRKAWQTACNEKLPLSWQMRCIPSLIDFYNKEGQTDSVNYFIQAGEKLAGQLPPKSIAVLGFLHTKLDIDFYNGHYKEVVRQMLKMRAERTIDATPSFYRRVAECHHRLGNDGQAYIYMDSACIRTDSLAREEMTSRMAEFNAKYETQAKEFEISRLEQKQLEKDAFWMKTCVAVLVVIALLTIRILLLSHKRKLADAQMAQLKKETELNSARKYIEGLENERKRFAKELHDGIANDLLGLQLRINILKKTDDLLPLAEWITKMRENIREISHELMPPEFDRLNLDDILSHYLSALAEHTGIKVLYLPANDMEWQRIPHEVSYEVYRIVQELTANILKYACASEIRITFHAPDKEHIELKIADNGKGMDRQDEKSYGIGLRTVKDRIKTIAATFTVRTSGKGSEYTIVFPYGGRKEKPCHPNG